MTKDAELLTRDPRGYSSFAGDFPAELFFTGVGATGALNREDVEVLKNLKCNKS